MKCFAKEYLQYSKSLLCYLRAARSLRTIEDQRESDCQDRSGYRGGKNGVGNRDDFGYLTQAQNGASWRQ